MAYPYEEPLRASQQIGFLSNQLLGYAQEVAHTVKEISDQYEFSEEFALRIVQTAIEDMKMDVAHNKNYNIELVANSIQMISEELSDIRKVYEVKS